MLARMPESIFLTTTARNTAARPWLTANLERVVRASEAYAGGDFVRADDPRRADFILFVDSEEPYLGDVLRAPLFRACEERSYVHNVNDAAVAVLPGMYPDIQGPPRLPDLQLGAFYLRCFDNQALLPRDETWSPKYLFSFVGNVSTAPAVRGRILALPPKDALLMNRSSGLRDDDLDYVGTLRASKFVLCPRGLGPTSWRFYETMMAGRVPVIVSDGWVPARELDWPSFSLRVAESDIASIPALCAANESRAAEMGRRARDEWERCCSLQQTFGWIGRRLRELREARSRTPFHARREFLRELRYRGHVRKYARWKGGQTLRALGLR